MTNRALNEKGSIIVIGDVHGCYKTLLALINKLPKDIPICFAGDLIDRGPESNKVVEFVRENNHYCVKGNHEDMMVTYYQTRKGGFDFVNNGGGKTMSSYGSHFFENEKVKSDVEWMASLPTYLEFQNIKNDKEDHLLVTHSYAHPVWKNKDKLWPKTFDSSLMWNRNTRVKPIPGIYNVIGHTPKENGPIIRSCYANIDTGAVFSDFKGLGKLTALQFPEMIITQQDNIDFIKTEVLK